MKTVPWMPRVALGAALLALAWGASGCGEASAADETVIASLSERELLGLCDELRDPVTRWQRPQKCSDGWTVQLVAPSNASCRLADRSTCDASAGDVRACSAAVLADPCGSASEPPAACDRLAGCDPSLVPSAVLDECPGPTLEEYSINDFSILDGVYAVRTHALSTCDAIDTEEDSSDLPPRLATPTLAPMAAEGFWAVTIGADASRAAVNIHWCEEPDHCRAIVEGSAAPEPSAALTAQPLPLCWSNRGTSTADARSRRHEESCQIPTTSSTLARIAPGQLRLETVTRSAPPPHDPRGCGFILAEPALYEPPCQTVEVYTAGFLLAQPLSPP
jgi:hypothetical protein